MYLGKTSEDELPTDSSRLITRASELITDSMFENYNSNNVNHVEAAKLATCAQVEYWIKEDESTAISGGIKSYRTGDTSIVYGDDAMPVICQRSRNYLNKQGLLYRGLKTHRHNHYVNI